jgi:hypothetical protein
LRFFYAFGDFNRHYRLVVSASRSASAGRTKMETRHKLVRELAAMDPGAGKTAQPDRPTSPWKRGRN